VAFLKLALSEELITNFLQANIYYKNNLHLFCSKRFEKIEKYDEQMLNLRPPINLNPGNYLKNKNKITELELIY
jgi:hypothetical protein